MVAVSAKVSARAYYILIEEEEVEFGVSWAKEMKLVGNTGIWLDMLCSSEMGQQLKLEFTVFWLL